MGKKMVQKEDINKVAKVGIEQVIVGIHKVNNK